jgi:hypothetical protein
MRTIGSPPLKSPNHIASPHDLQLANIGGLFIATIFKNGDIVV